MPVVSKCVRPIHTVKKATQARIKSYKNKEKSHRSKKKANQGTSHTRYETCVQEDNNAPAYIDTQAFGHEDQKRDPHLDTKSLRHCQT